MPSDIAERPIRVWQWSFSKECRIAETCCTKLQSLMHKTAHRHEGRDERLQIGEASKLQPARISSTQATMFKLKNDIIFTKSLRTSFAGEYMSVEPDFSPEGQPNRKLAEECFAPHQKYTKETRKDPRTAPASSARKKSKMRRTKTV